MAAELSSDTDRWRIIGFIRTALIWPLTSGLIIPPSVDILNPDSALPKTPECFGRCG